jgi:hypothetical protein
MHFAARKLIRRVWVVPFYVVLYKDRGGTGQAEGKAAPTASTSLHRSFPRQQAPGAGTSRKAF